MEQYALYLVMKQQLLNIDSSFKCSFNDMDSNRPNSVGIYVKSGGTPRRREISTGSYYNYMARVQFDILGDNSKTSLMNVLSLASRLRNTLQNSSNKVFYVQDEQIKWVNGAIVYDPDGSLVGSDIEVILCKVALLGEVDSKGKTGQGLPRYSLNIRAEYYVKDKEEN